MEYLTRIQSPEEIAKRLTDLSKVATCCISTRLNAGLCSLAQDELGLVEDVLMNRVEYWFSENGSYLRTFNYREELIVDFGRRLRDMGANAKALAHTLGQPVVVPLHHHRIGVLKPFEDLPGSARTFIFTQEHPTARQTFKHSQIVYAVGIIQPD